jgi:glycosyltransferase involved in cell wall biosynthesis
VPGLTAVVITKNERSHIADCLRSVAWADERLVVDSGSTDDTVAAARQAGARVIARDWPGYAAQKNRGAAEAAHDWILSVDADERVSPGLAAEIRQALEGPSPARGYRLPRESFYLGAWIRSTDWYPDYQLRLYDRRFARWGERPVHESVQVDGEVGQLRAPLQHYPYRDIADHLDTINRYTTLAAEQMHRSGRRASLAGIVVHPQLAFLRNYVLRGGIRQGGVGLVVSSLNSYYVFLKLAKLWALNRSK